MTAHAAPANDIAPITDLVAQLDAPELEARERAAVELLERTGELSDALGSDVNASDLSPEQRTRIASALRQRFLLTPRAGLGAGIGEPPGQPGQGALVSRTVPGFPAARLLQENDIVLEAHGVSLVGLTVGEADFTFRCSILSLEPGEAIRLKIQRNAEILEVEVPTKSFAELNNPNTFQPEQRYLEGAWRLRAQRLGLHDGEIERMSEGDRRTWAPHVKRRSDVPAVIPAGRARAVGDADRSRALLAKLDRDQNQRMRLADEERVRHLERFIADLHSRLDDGRTALGNERPGSKSAARLQANIREYERQLQIAQRQYKETRARLGQLRNR